MKIDESRAVRRALRRSPLLYRQCALLFAPTEEQIFPTLIVRRVERLYGFRSSILLSFGESTGSFSIGRGISSWSELGRGMLWCRCAINIREGAWRLWRSKQEIWVVGESGRSNERRQRWWKTGWRERSKHDDRLYSFFAFLTAPLRSHICSLPKELQNFRQSVLKKQQSRKLIS